MTAYCLSVLQGCGAVATDSTGQDISSSILVVDVTPCGTGTGTCPACDITFAAAGFCPPGSYLYLYRYDKTTEACTGHCQSVRLLLSMSARMRLSCGSLFLHVADSLAWFLWPVKDMEYNLHTDLTLLMHQDSIIVIAAASDLLQVHEVTHIKLTPCPLCHRLTEQCLSA